jgi:inner membrane protein
LLVGLVAALARGSLRANAVGLVLSTAYLAWGVAAQQHVERVARASLASQGIAAAQVLVTPTAFNSVLWRVLVVDGASYREGFYSLLDETAQVRFDAFARGTELAPALDQIDSVRRIADFSRGFYKLSSDGPELRITDLRMGQEPFYTFSFVVAEQRSAAQAVLPRNEGRRPDIGRALEWIGRRAWGEPLPPPR